MKSRMHAARKLIARSRRTQRMVQANRAHRRGCEGPIKCPSRSLFWPCTHRGLHASSDVQLHAAHKVAHLAASCGVGVVFE
eukprot:1557460-Rhodomonas_salina.4